MSNKMRADGAQRILKALEKAGIGDAEIAYRTGACIQSVWRWKGGRAPLPVYYSLLCDLAKMKGIQTT